VLEVEMTMVMMSKSGKKDESRASAAARKS
jgi:hypothetical protein